MHRTVGVKPPKIDTSQIPPVAMRNLGQALIDACERLFSNPEVQKEFEEWEKAQNYATK